MPIYPRVTSGGITVYDVVIHQRGKAIWKRGFRTEPLAKRYETSEESKRDQGINVSPVNLTLGEYLEKWLEDYASTLEPTTYKTYCTNLRVHVIGHCACTKPGTKLPLPVNKRHKFGERCPNWHKTAVSTKRLSLLTASDVQALYSQIIKKKRGKSTLSAKTALNVHRVLREALQHAVRMELITRNVCDLVPPPKARKYLVAPPTQDGLARLLELTDQTRYAALVRTCLWTGLRQSELLNLKRDDLDLENRVLYVRKAKWGSERTVTLSPEIMDALRSHLDSSAGEYVFVNQDGGQIDAGGLKRSWKVIKQQTGLRFHDLRHAHASLLLAAGIHAAVIKDRLGHRNISTTMDIYGHLMPGLQEQAANSIDRMMRRD